MKLYQWVIIRFNCGLGSGVRKLDLIGIRELLLKIKESQEKNKRKKETCPSFASLIS